MKLGFSLSLVVLSLVVGLVYPGWTGAAAPPDYASRPGRTAIGVLCELQQAWLEGSSKRIARLFKPGGAFLALGEDAPPAGKYSPFQIRYLIGDLLKLTATESFEYLRFERKRKEPAARVSARWTYRRAPAVRPVEQKLALILVETPEGWVISRFSTAD